MIATILSGNNCNMIQKRDTKAYPGEWTELDIYLTRTQIPSQKPL
jgi:hypothetical protein